MQKRTNYGAVLALFLVLAGQIQAAEIFPYRSGWNYVLGTNEASAPSTAWRTNGFNDAAWLTGSAPVGYPSAGATGLEGTIQTTLPTSTAGGYTCVFLRKTFVLNNPAQVTALTLQVQYDDGYAAWVNGTEIGRAGVTDPLSFATLATDHEVTVSEDSKTLTSGLSSLLVLGTNVVAVQLFNSGSGSSDLFIDAALSGELDEAPTILATDPVPNGIVSSLTYVTVTFTEGVSGVEAGDLLINGLAATNVAQNNPREYQFGFTPPPTGSVTVAWAANPGIADLDGVAHAFVPGPAWTYTLNPNAVSGAAIISEFLADNANGIADEDGTRADWIEIYNPGLVDVNLSGWFLAEDPGNLLQWRFPAVILGPNKYLLVWASEKNRANPAGPLHTNFKLSKNAGRFLFLLDAQTNLVSYFESYPAQTANISYGRDRIDPNIVGYFTTPTPGAQNSTTGSGFAPAPALSLESGVYTNASLSLVLTVPPGTTVRYTTDGSLPTASSTTYATPITVQNNTTIKLRAFPFAAGIFPSEVVVRNFVFLDASTRDFNSNLPILILSTEGRGMASSVAPGQPRTRGTLVVFDTFRGRSALNGKPEHIRPAEFEIFGQTSAGFPKKPYNIEIQDALGNDHSESVLGLPAEADWKLRNPYSDKCLMNDFLAYELFDQMGNYSCRRKFVEVFVDTGGGRLSYPGDYVGVEVFLEKIERGDNRVDIKELSAAHTNGPAITGGYMFKKDKDSGGDLNFSGGGQALKLHEPKPNSMRTTQGATTSWPGPGYTPSATNQLSYLTGYLDAFSTAMNAPDWLTRTGTNHYSHYIDVDAFVDQHWIVEFPKQIDGYRISNFYSKDRGRKVAPVPIWDWNLSFGNANYLDGGHFASWYYVALNNADQHIWLSRLIGNQAIPNGATGDPDFIQKLIDRWGVLRTNVMNGDRLVSRIDELASQLSEAAARNYNDKYTGLLNTYTWPNPIEGQGWDVDYSQPTYELIISEMKKWTAGRYAWIDAQFPKGPQLNLPAGGIAPGSSLPISAPAGIIYYTLDGTDPRRSQANGAIAPGALTYSTPVTLNSNARVFARARVGSVWSPPAISTYVVQSPRLVISEIMYHPAAPTPGPGVTNLDEDFEYIEVMNVGAGSLNLNGFSISGGVDFTFPSVTLPAGQRLVVVKNRSAFTNRYGASLDAAVAGEFTGSLADDGNRLVLQGALKEPLLDFSYDDAWHPMTDGFGFSLVIVDENAAANTWGLAGRWRPSGVLHGTPGTGDGAAPAFPPVVINEALTHSDPPPPIDTIELRNLSAAPVDIGGWFLTDDFRTPKKYRIADGVSIAAGGFVTFDESQFNTPAPISFALGSSGDSAYLFSADVAGNLTGYHHGFDFGAARNGVTLGRHLNSQGDEHFVAQSGATLGAANAGPLVGPIVVSEIQYHPVDVFANGAFWNNTEDEYIELHNLSGATVPLYDPAAPTNTWKLRDAVSYTFPTNVSIPAGGFVLVASINPADAAALAAFRARYGLAANLPVFGPWSGELDNSGAKVELVRPDSPEPGSVPYVLVERVPYTDLAPWDGIADGVGASLQRLVTGDYGNDPTNWIAASVSPAAARGAGAAVAITQQPASLDVFIGATASFTPVVSGTGVTYQWRFNGSLIPGATGATLTLTNVQTNQSGQYSFLAFNGAGSVLSSNATINVRTPLYFSVQPSSQNVLPGTNVTIQSLALGNGPVRYQWRYEGTNLPNATNASSSFTGASMTHHGRYSVVAEDDFHTATSSNAFIFVLVKPVILTHLTAQTVLQGGTATFSLAATGAPPLWYRWIRNGGGLPGATTSVPVLVITNVQASGSIRVAVTNVASPSGTPSPGPTPGNSVLLTMLPDVDGDGMADSWEVQHGFSTNSAADALFDFDGDGMSNRDEYLSRTNPTNALSVLKILLTATNAARLNFVAQSNLSYSVLWRADAASGFWSNLTSITAQPLVRTVEVNAASAPPAPQRFLRIVTPMVP